MKAATDANGALTDKARKGLTKYFQDFSRDPFTSLNSAFAELELYLDTQGLVPMFPSTQVKLPPSFLVEIRTSGSKSLTLREKLLVSWTKKGSNFHVKLEFK